MPTLPPEGPDAQVDELLAALELEFQRARSAQPRKRYLLVLATVLGLGLLVGGLGVHFIVSALGWAIMLAAVVMLVEDCLPELAATAAEAKRRAAARSRRMGESLPPRFGRPER